MSKPPRPELVMSLFEALEAAVPVAEDVPVAQSKSSNYPPPDAAERSMALDPSRSFLVQAPAGSGKTYLLTQRFLRLLGKAEKPDEIVAITFTNAAASEMRSRILSELENVERRPDMAASEESRSGADPESLRSLAELAMARDLQRGWKILDQPGQLRIMTIDAFCRSLALQASLEWGQLSGLGGRLEPASDPDELYRRAASGLMDRLLREDAPSDVETSRAMEALMLWRDNNWSDVESLLVKMLAARNRWYQDFVFKRIPDWDALRKRLEAPFCRAAQKRLQRLADLLDVHPDGRERITDLARFACNNGGKSLPEAWKREELLDLLASRTEFKQAELLADAVATHQALANFLLTEKKWRKAVNKHHGFPTTEEGKQAKEWFGHLISDLAQVEGLHEALLSIQNPTPTCYTAEEWELIRHSFTVLRAAAVELQFVFAETGSVDFTEISQIALRILAPENGYPPEFAMRQAESIRHLLVDEFQDTSRNQHQLLSRLVAAWPDREGRSCFCVGDPMQSIYGFRDAEVELFERLKSRGLELATPDLSTGDLDADTSVLPFEFLALRANFRTSPSLVDDLNGHFKAIFATDDGSGVEFSPAVASRPAGVDQFGSAKTELHLAFTSKKCPPAQSGVGPDVVLAAGDPEKTREAQLAEVVELVRAKLAEMDEMQQRTQEAPEASQEKFRIAILGRTKKSLILIADALRGAKIVYRAIELVPLGDRPEVLDALSLARALLNPFDRTAWLGLLRAPWCGLSLEELYWLVSSDDESLTEMPVPVLLESRLIALRDNSDPDGSPLGRPDARAIAAATKVSRVMQRAEELRPESSSIGLGSWLESVWAALGGEDTVSEEQHANLRLLWAALDKLPDGELDLLGPALPAALSKLCALPDPSASSNFGVQLMTIHKSKGLEFEVVIVPDLEAEGQKDDQTLISWLERGTAEQESEHLTEFLIAPIQPKGDDAGAAKKWVDEIKRKRNQQELRRLLYVAATRAREELHLFARPRFLIRKATPAKGSSEADPGGPALDRTTGLLDTAWPAIGASVELRFQEWLAAFAKDPMGDRGLDLAAQAESSLNGMDMHPAQECAVQESSNLIPWPGSNLLADEPAPSRPPLPTLLRRLPSGHEPPDFRLGRSSNTITSPPLSLSPEERAGSELLYARAEGSLQSRLEGIAIHSFLESLSRIRSRGAIVVTPEDAAQELSHLLPRVAANLRSRGLASPHAQKVAADALVIAQQCSIDPEGAWILGPHHEAVEEAQWTGILAGEQRNLRPDRVFLACSPQRRKPDLLREAASEEEAGAPAWWIIDYKTTSAHGIDLADPDARLAFLDAHREQYNAQLSSYAELLRKLEIPQHSQNAGIIYTGIYYPRLRIFDFWMA